MRSKLEEYNKMKPAAKSALYTTARVEAKAHESSTRKK